MEQQVMSVIMKPAVQALLALHPIERGEHWLERLAAASFDLERWEDVTPEQRRWAKLTYYAWIYGASVGTMIDAFEAFGACASRVDGVLASWNALIDGTRPARSTHETLIKVLEIKCREAAIKPDATDKRVIKGQGWSRPKPKGSY